MATLLFIAIAVFAAYLSATIYKFGKPKSVSDSYYLWQQSKQGYLFTLSLALVAFLLLPYWLVQAEELKCQFLSFLSCGGLLFVATACQMREELTRPVHCTSAVLWGGSAVVFMLINGLYYSALFGALFGLCGYIADRCKHWIFWLEIAVVMVMIIGLIQI